MNTTMNRSTKPSSTPTARTSILSRLLASENLRIVHDANMKSAAFDLTARTLILPMWRCDKIVYDMLVGHEVAHAKYTPPVRWKTAADEIGGKKFARVAQDYINVIEDARIERMIKREFPGLRADFIAGYKHLHETMDIFQIKGKDISKMSLIDRINLHYKIGVHCGVTIPFSADERPILDRINATRDGERGFEDVVAIARDLFTMKQEQDENNDDAEGDANGKGEQQDEKTDKRNNGKGQKPEGCEGEESDTDESSNGSDDQDGNEEQSGGSSADGEEEQDGEGSSSGKGNEDGEGTDESAEDDTDDGESAESTQTKGETKGETGKVKGEYAPTEVSTSTAMSNGIEKFADSTYSEEIISIGRIDPRKVVVSVKDFMNLCDNGGFITGPYGKSVTADAATVETAALKAFKRVTDANKRNVELMCKRFEVKRAARNHARTSSCKSGRISTRQLSKYKFSEDIFDRLTIKQDEKNHGLVILLDWSGSIGYMISETVSQLTALLHFCRRAGIPAEVYFFTTQYCPSMDQAFLDANPHIKGKKNWKDIMNNSRRYGCAESGVKWNAHDEARAFSDQIFDLPAGTTAKGGCAVLQPFSLIKVYEQNMNAKAFARAMGRLILLAGTQGGGCTEVNEYGLSSGTEFQLGGTPLDESILAMREIVKDFRKSSNTKVTLVNLTDGDGMSVVCRTEAKNKKVTARVVMDEETGRRFEGGNFGHAEVMQMFKDATDVQAVGIFITRVGINQSCNIGMYGRYLNERFVQRGKWQISDEGKKVLENDEKQWKEQKFVAFPYAPYDMYFMVNIPDRAQAKRQAEMEDAKVERMKNKKVAATRAFIAAMRAEESNRMFINRLMDIIA